MNQEFASGSITLNKFLKSHSIDDESIYHQELIKAKIIIHWIKVQFKGFPPQILYRSYLRKKLSQSLNDRDLVSRKWPSRSSL